MKFVIIVKTPGLVLRRSLNNTKNLLFKIMKATVFLIVFVSTANFAFAQESGLVGKWKIIEYTYSNPNGSEKVVEDQIKSSNTIADYFIMEDGTFRQVSNMSGTGSLETYDGNWKTTGNNTLTITLKINSKPLDLEWKYELKGDTLIITRSNPARTLTISNTFRKSNTT